MATKYSVIGFGGTDVKYLQTHHPDSLTQLRETGYSGDTIIYLDVSPMPGQISPPVKSYQRAIGAGIGSKARLIKSNYEGMQIDLDNDPRQRDLDEATEQLMDRHQPKAEGLVSKLNGPIIRLLAKPADYKFGQVLDSVPRYSVILGSESQWHLKHEAA